MTNSIIDVMNVVDAGDLQLGDILWGIVVDDVRLDDGECMIDMDLVDE